MLSSWVWTSEWANYAKQVAWNAGIDLNAKVNTLDDQQIAQLQMAKIAKSLPGLAKNNKQKQHRLQHQKKYQQMQSLGWMLGTRNNGSWNYTDEDKSAKESAHWKMRLCNM